MLNKAKIHFYSKFVYSFKKIKFAKDSNKTMLNERLGRGEILWMVRIIDIKNIPKTNVLMIAVPKYFLNKLGFLETFWIKTSPLPQLQTLPKL